MTRPALLVLEDGTFFRGAGFGAHGTATGEICFNTSLAGYQEVLTDPSYHGQIVTMTAPQIGNTGVNTADDQAAHGASGLVVRDLSPMYSSWRATGSLHDHLVRRGVVTISGIDTRRLTRHLRSAGAMRAAVSDEVLDPGELAAIVRASPGYAGRDLAVEVSTRTPYEWGLEDLERRGAMPSPPPSGSSRPPLRIAAFDFGIKRNILDLLVVHGFEVTVVPARTSPSEILGSGHRGVFLSNGPGDPEPVRHAIETTTALLGRLPVFGICLGHQILALALGGSTYKLSFGHRGGNHPVARLGRDRIEITCQNHGFAVDEKSLAETPARVTHVNLNDATVEGLEVPGRAFGVQYHPESGPGPHDSRYLFEEFRGLIEGFEPGEREPAPARSAAGA